MTEGQVKVLMSTIRRIDSNTQEVADRLRWLYPSPAEMRAEVQREIESLLDCDVKVFTED